VYAEIAARKNFTDLKHDRIAALEAQVTEKTAEIEKAHRAIQHKTRVEGVLAGIAGGLTLILLVFYVAHAIMGW
jgi:tetrahydromethanopterin S-methyltransferase subunit G